MAAKNKKAIRAKLNRLVDLLSDQRPDDPNWRKSLKKSMTVFNAIIQRDLGGKSISVAKKREVRQKLSEFRDMISAILGGESWAVVLYYMRKNPPKSRKRQTA